MLTTQAFKEGNATRAGVEGLISESAFVLGLRRSRYRGLAKTHFQHLATAAALNLKRTAYWYMAIPCITTGPPASQLWPPHDPISATTS